jgi:hypothetical protein
MATAATMASSWSVGNTKLRRSRTASVVLRQDAVRRDAARWWAENHPRGFGGQTAPVAGFEAEKLTRWRSTGGALAELGAYMMARPEEATLLLTQLRGYAATARELEAVTFVEAVMKEQVEDGIEDVLEQKALIEGTPKSKREFARQARKLAALLEDAAYAAEREADEQEGRPC